MTMPAKKTFQSIRVRGPVQLDGAATIKGVPLVAHKLYVATLNQSLENAPVATVLVNTLGGNVVWSRADVGEYIGTLAGAFPPGKTVVFVSGREIDVLMVGLRVSDYQIKVHTVELNGSPIDGYLNGSALEIRVYS
jgi:hypothetical protein